MSALKLTTRTGVTCPNCGKDLEIETEGLFGGILTQLLMQGALAAIKRNGKGNVTATCEKCGHKFTANTKEK